MNEKLMNEIIIFKIDRKMQNRYRNENYIPKEIHTNLQAMHLTTSKTRERTIRNQSLWSTTPFSILEIANFFPLLDNIEPENEDHAEQQHFGRKVRKMYMHVQWIWRECVKKLLKFDKIINVISEIHRKQGQHPSKLRNTFAFSTFRVLFVLLHFFYINSCESRKEEENMQKKKKRIKSITRMKWNL